MSFKAILSKIPDYAKLLLFVGLIFICSILFSYLANWISNIVYGISIGIDSLDVLDIEDRDTISALKVFQIIQSIGIYFVSAIIFGYLAFDRPYSFFKLNKLVSLKSVLLVFVILFALTPLVTLLIEINKSIDLPEILNAFEEKLVQAEHTAEKLTKAFLKMSSFSDLMINLFMIGVIPAIGEELLFRGILQQLLHKVIRNIHAAIFITAFVFGAIHGQFYGIIPRMLLGAVFGYLFYWSKSLWVPILAHFLNNGVQIIIYYLYLTHVIETNIEEVDSMPYSVTIFGTIILVMFIFAFYKENIKPAGHPQNGRVGLH